MDAKCARSLSLQNDEGCVGVFVFVLFNQLLNEGFHGSSTFWALFCSLCAVPVRCILSRKMSNAKPAQAPFCQILRNLANDT